MAKTHGVGAAAVTEAPRREVDSPPRHGDPLGEQVVDERHGGRSAAEQAAIEPATQPIVAEAGADPLGYVQMVTERPGVNDRSGATDEAIARRAYELYQARGGVEGADMDDWLQAERELHAGDGPAEERENPAHRPID
jgi:hypothetical protein